MVECKISLELTKNGIQKSIHAKAGESNSRKLVITLTEAGKVFELSGLNARVFLEDGTYIDDGVSIVGNTVEFILPAALFALEGIRFCEIKIFRGEYVLYSPMIELIIEKSFGNVPEEEAAALGKKVQYQELIATTKQKESAEMADDDSIVIYDIKTGTVMRLTWAQLREIHNAEDSHPIEVINGLDVIINGLATAEEFDELSARISQEAVMRKAKDNEIENKIIDKKISEAVSTLSGDIDDLWEDVVTRDAARATETGANAESIAVNAEKIAEIDAKVDSNKQSCDEALTLLTKHIEAVQSRGDAKLEEQVERIDELSEDSHGHNNADILSNLSADATGNLLYNGVPVDSREALTDGEGGHAHTNLSLLEKFYIDSSSHLNVAGKGTVAYTGDIPLAIDANEVANHLIGGQSVNLGSYLSGAGFIKLVEMMNAKYGGKVKSKTFTNWEDCDVSANIMSSDDVVMSVWDMSELENTHIIDVGIILRTDESAEFKEYNIFELIKSNFLYSSSTSHIIGKPTFSEDLDGYPIAIFGHVTIDFMNLALTEKNIKGFTVYYLEE